MQYKPPVNPASSPFNSSAELSSPWIISPQPRPQPKIRLFCFPYAGGGASAFRRWASELPSTVELICIQLPGRESRFREAPISHLPTLIQQLKPAILPYLSVPYAFFGHSMGALIAFELARSLHQADHPLPQHFFVSACCAPNLPRHEPPRYTLSKPDLITELRRLKGTPTEVLNDDEWMDLLLPVVKADFEVVDAYVYHAQSPLPLPITILGGQEDPEVSLEELLPWQKQTSSEFSSHTFRGDHFFIQPERLSVLHLILETLLLWI